MNPPADNNAIRLEAQRFAKLLVDQIKLYNKSKVEKGRAQRDLYERLKDEIERGRAAYEKRYGYTAAGADNYFDQEILRNLADNDRSLLGQAFPR